MDILVGYTYNKRMYNIIQLVETALETVATVGPAFLDDVNDFPSVAIVRPSIASSRRAVTTRAHIGDRTVIDFFTFTVRGYSYSEDSIGASEQLARDIEQVIQSIKSDKIYSAKVLEVHTDEGLFSPYGICDIRCRIEWITK